MGGWQGQVRTLAYSFTLTCMVVLPIITTIWLLPLVTSAWRNRKWL